MCICLVQPVTRKSIIRVAPRCCYHVYLSLILFHIEFQHPIDSWLYPRQHWNLHPLLKPDISRNCVFGPVPDSSIASQPCSLSYDKSLGSPSSKTLQASIFNGIPVVHSQFQMCLISKGFDDLGPVG